MLFFRQHGATIQQTVDQGTGQRQAGVADLLKFLVNRGSVWILRAHQSGQFQAMRLQVCPLLNGSFASAENDFLEFLPLFCRDSQLPLDIGPQQECKQPSTTHFSPGHHASPFKAPRRHIAHLKPATGLWTVSLRLRNWRRGKAEGKKNKGK